MGTTTESSDGSARNRAVEDQGVGRGGHAGPRGSGAPLSRRVLVTVVSLLPWIAALFLLYALESRAVWQAGQSLRPLASVTILASGMALSFLLHSWLLKRD